MERDACHRIRVCGIVLDELARPDVPNLDRLIGGRRGDAVPVRVKQNLVDYAAMIGQS